MNNWIIQIIESLGYFGIAFLMFMDNIFPPIPSEVIMPSAGYTASRGQLQIVGVIVAGSLGSILAAALLYAIGRKISHAALFKWVDRYGKYLFIKSKDLEKALNWFEHYGHRIVFFGRMIPAVRSLISIPAGMSRMPFGKFMLYSSFGTIIWTTFLACVGFYFGENQELMFAIMHRVGYIILTITLLFVGWWIYRKFYKTNNSR
ncbi:MULTISPECIES: DedA family protein [unclassified Acinetobacter]|uniref:DedA family protein n=1 Tax=unclassified Acinetobacter TaxID=196816 RepID=UPI00190CB385|nr:MULTISPECIES: DedA family protein [unclassified Acinetobacter]MBK0064036.1 DedA family protein [Acinetobacter sp. S55]MBK0067455.1 DedA family protein [Acinetobacter sp. S54]